MRGLLRYTTRQQLMLFFCALLLVALIYSPFLLSVSMFGLFVVSVLEVQFVPSFRLGFNPELRANFKAFLSNKAYLAVTLFFFIVLLSGLFTDDFSYWLERLRLKVPFLGLPFVFASMPKLSRRQYLGLFYFLVLLIFVTSIGIGVNYALNFEAIQVAIGRGQAIPTPRNHIRFSLVLALSILAGGHLFTQQFYWRKRWERWLILGITLFLFFFIHVLSVRSGLLVLYMAIGVLAVRYMVVTKKYAVGIAGLAGLLLLPILAYIFVPSFKMKIDYARWDLKMHLSGKGEHYSDSGRITSLKVGLQIGNEHPVLGVGAGDLKQEVQRVYANDYATIDQKLMPHNQLVSVYAGMGIVGLLLFLFAFFYPLFYHKNYRDNLFLAFHVVVFFSFMIENTIENSIGIAFYVFFLLLGLNFLSEERDGSKYQ